MCSRSQDVVVLRIQFDVILLEISVKLWGTENLGNLHQLIIVVMSMEKWLLSENLRRG